MAKEGRETIHRSEKMHVWLSLISKKVRKKKCYALIVGLQFTFFFFLGLIFRCCFFYIAAFFFRYEKIVYKPKFWM